MDPAVIHEQTEQNHGFPQMMQAAALDRFGGPDVLQLHSLPVPELGKGEILIEIDSAGVGIWDAMMRGGWWPEGKPRFPLVLGSDGAGRVAAMESQDRRFRIGDPVYAYSFANPKGGFYAEYVAVSAEFAAPIPRNLSMQEAGAIGTTGLTALQGIDDVLQVRRDESVVIYGASGGVGTLAVQFAKLRGAKVLAVASGADGVFLVRRLGADAAVDGRKDDVHSAIRAFAGNGVDAILACSGGETLGRAIEMVKAGGRVGYPNGVQPAPEKYPAIRIEAYDAKAGVDEFARLNQSVEAAKLQVPIMASFPVAEAANAHERIEKGHVLGKIVLRVR
jgi:NADPH:quinone reductase-like Zn-dependent oxidoreductase